MEAGRVGTEAKEPAAAAVAATTNMHEATAEQEAVAAAEWADQSGRTTGRENLEAKTADEAAAASAAVRMETTRAR